MQQLCLIFIVGFVRVLLFNSQAHAQTIEATLEPINVECGDIAILVCNITGGTGLDTFWYHEGQPDAISTNCGTSLNYIVIDPRCNVTAEYYAIQIHNTSLNRDSGNWTCKYADEQSDSLNVTILDIPTPPDAQLMSGEVASGQEFVITVYGDCAHPDYNLAICFHDDVGCFSENVTCESDCGPFQSVSSTGTIAMCDTCDGMSVAKNVTFSAQLKSEYSNGMTGEFYFIYTGNGWDDQVEKSQIFPFTVNADDSLSPGVIAAIIAIGIIGSLAIVGGVFYLCGWKRK